MFAAFFYLLRQRGLHVSLNEWMTLLEGMEKGLHHSTLTGFYHLCRAIVVKNETEFDRLGAFTYSPEENTPAATFDHQVEESVKEDWQADVMELQEEIILDKNESMIGKEILVMIEGKVADENAYVGRSYRDAPDIDGLVFVNTDTELVSGDFVKVRITGAYEYDLIGELM